VSVVGRRSYSRDKSPILASGEEKPTMVVVVEQGAPDWGDHHSSHYQQNGSYRRVALGPVGMSKPYQGSCNVHAHHAGIILRFHTACRCSQFKVTVKDFRNRSPNQTNHILSVSTPLNLNTLHFSRTTFCWAFLKVGCQLGLIREMKRHVL